MLLHRHCAHEMLRVRNGTLELLLNGTSILLHENDIYLIRGDAFHALNPSPECVYDCIVFDPVLLLSANSTEQTYMKQINEQAISLHSDIKTTDAITQRACEQLFSLILQSNAQECALEIHGLLLQMIGHMLRSGSYDSCAPMTQHTKKTSAAIDSVLRLMREKYALCLTLTDMSDTAGLSPNYFCRYFKKLAGCAPVDYLINYRILAAEHMLRSTDCPIAQIAVECGFNDASHFIKFFRRKKGTTPRQYRSAHRVSGKIK
jgi:AraC-like DNA-binding protein